MGHIKSEELYVKNMKMREIDVERKFCKITSNREKSVLTKIKLVDIKSRELGVDLR